MKLDEEAAVELVGLVQSIPSELHIHLRAVNYQEKEISGLNSEVVNVFENALDLYRATQTAKAFLKRLIRDIYDEDELPKFYLEQLLKILNMGKEGEEE